MAPSKTFNMPGISTSICVIQNPALWEQFHTYMEASELEMGNVFSYTSAAAAYSEGEEWLLQLKAYLLENIDFTQAFLEEHLPMVSMIRPQASYLIFLDFRKLGWSQEMLTRVVMEDAHLALNDGTMFGQRGEGFLRLNVGCPKSVLNKALHQLADAINKKLNI